MKSLHLKNNFYSLLSAFLGAILGFIMFFVVIRTYPKTVFAEWIYYITIVTFAEFLRSGLINPGVIKHLAEAKNEKEQREVIGAGWIIYLITIIIASLLCYGLMFIIDSNNVLNKVGMVLMYYPLFAAVSSIININSIILQVRNRYHIIFFIRFGFQSLIVAFYICNYFYLHLPVVYIVVGQIIAMGFVALVLLVRNYGCIQSVLHTTLNSIKKLLNFGKYTMGITIGGNLLSSSDVLIIGMMMTKVDVAIYAVPLKVIEYLQLVLNSFSDVAYPFLSKYSKEKGLQKTKEIFYKYTGMITLLFAPVLLIMFFGAHLIILIVSGQEYVESGVTATLLRIFLICALFLPLDRFSGNLLDSIGLPKYNFIKVISMVCVNVLGDILAIILFNSLEIVAIVTLVTTASGILISYKYLRAHMQIRFTQVLPHGLKVFQQGVNYILNRRLVRERT